MNRPLAKQRLILACKVGLAGSLMAWLALSGRLQFGRLASVPMDGRLATLFALVAGSMVLPAVRWYWLLRIQCLTERFSTVMSLTWTGYFAGLLLPGAAGGDLARSYLILRRSSHARARAFSTVLADRYLGIFSLFCLGAVAAGWGLWRGPAGTSGIVISMLVLVPLVAMAISIMALLYRPSQQRLLRVLPLAWQDAWHESFVLYRTSLPQLLGCFGLSLVSSMMTIAALAVAGRLIGETISWNTAFLAGPLIVVSNCLPVTPGGVGLAEAVSSELFSKMGSGSGAELMILTRLVTALVSLPGLWTLLSSSRRRPNPTTEVNADPPVTDDMQIDETAIACRGL